MSWRLLAEGSFCCVAHFLFRRTHAWSLYLPRLLRDETFQIVHPLLWKIGLPNSGRPNFQPNAFHDLFTASLSRLVEQERLNPLRLPPHFCIFFIGNTCSVLSVFIIIRQCLYCRCCWFF